MAHARLTVWHPCQQWQAEEWRGPRLEGRDGLAPPPSFKEDTGPPSEFGLREHRRLPQGASPGASMYVPERFETIHVSLVLAPAAFMPAYDLRTSSPFAQRFSKIEYKPYRTV